MENSPISVTLLFLICKVTLGAKPHPLSDEYISQLNAKQSLWMAGSNFEFNNDPKMWSYVKKMAGGTLIHRQSNRSTRSNLRMTGSYDIKVTDIPEMFDAREKWPNCTSIGQVWDQGACGSSWAIAAVSAMSDRICIHSNFTDRPILSPEDLMSCCTDCRYGCDGGYPFAAWEYWFTNGITTGGAYNSTGGCKAYTNQPCGHTKSSTLTLCSTLEPACIPNCQRTCDAHSEVNVDSYDETLYFGFEPYENLYCDTTQSCIEQLKYEIMTNGPVEATFDVYADFLSYKGGIYSTVDLSEFVSSTSAKLIGWGIENNQSYWLGVNSWNTEWGENGLFKFLMLQPFQMLESKIVAAMPNFARSKMDSRPRNNAFKIKNARLRVFSFLIILKIVWLARFCI
ncbi:cathepsin B-like [Cylas formicarius]|uniref:cathepsin B-like n=1 Tax=Cylas formicarius TaxID=197179 RepID=UPI002958D5E6|nr:cathepsin B-like [Cylas formicarius]